MRDVAEAFAHDIGEHALHVLKDDGLYRHLRCKRPDTYCYGFDIVTWPGYLAYVGDMGDFVFSRVRDMFEFFASEASERDPDRINPQYWAEKIQGGGQRPAETFSERAFAAAVREWRDQVVEDQLTERYASDCDTYDSEFGIAVRFPWGQRRESLQLTWCVGPADDEVVSLGDLAKIDDFKSEVDRQLLRREVYSEESAYRLLDEFEWRDGYGDKHPILIEDAWDTLGSFREYEFRFLWCCHALVWAIAQYRSETRELVAHA